MVAGGQGFRGLNTKGPEGTLLGEKLFCMLIVVLMAVFVKTQTCILKRVHFTVCKLYSTYMNFTEVKWIKCVSLPKASKHLASRSLI